MALDIQPLDIQPLSEGLDIQPLDIQPLEETKKKGSLLEAPSGDVLTGPARALIANIPGTIAGGLAGLGSLIGSGDIDKAVETMGKTREATTFTDEATKRAEQGVGEAMAVPGQAVYGAVEPRFGQGAATAAQAFTDIGLNFVDPALVGKVGARALGRKATVPEAPKSKVDAFFEKKAEPVALDIRPIEVPEGVVKQSPMERMATELGAEQPAPNTAFTQMADQLGSREQFAREALDAQRADAAQATIDARNAQMASDMQRAVVPEMEAAARQRMEQQPVYSQEHRAFMAQQEALSRAQQEQVRKAQEQEAAQQAQVELQQKQLVEQGRVAEAQKAQEARQSQLELDVKRQATLDYNAAERARQEAAPVTNIPKGQPNQLFSSGFDLRNKEGESSGFKGVGASSNLSFPELSLAPVGEPLAPPPKFTPNAVDKKGAPLQVDRTVEQTGINYKVRDEKGNVLAQISFEQNPDGSLGAGHVQSFARGRGAAEALYKQAKKDGFTIRPGRAQTPEGAGLVKALQKKGIIEEGEITPTSKYFDTPNKVNVWEPSVTPGKQLVSEAEAQRLNAMGNIPGMKSKLPEFEPDLSTTPEFLEKHANTPDISQNVAQKAMNFTSKGGQYVAARTKDPFIKRATQRVRSAVNKSQAAIRDLIHAPDGYAPLLRSMSKDDYVEAAQLLQRADKENVPLNVNELREAGFSEPVVAAVEAHKAFTNKLQGPLLEAAQLAGIDNVNMRVAYAASKANHDFRVPVMKDGQVVGILTARTKLGLNNNMKKYKDIDGDVSFGAEQYFGGGRGQKNVEGFSQLYQWLSDQNPEVAKFADVLMEMNTKAAEGYLGAKKHTMDKKGVFGMAGDSPFKNPYENAKDFWDSQVDYGENVIKWAEMSKAADDVSKLMNDPNRPNANQYIKNYLDNALGRNPSAIGRGIDDVFAQVGKSLGVGTEIPGKIKSGVRSTVNTKLLAFSPAFLAQNIIQPLKTMPEMATFLSSRGLDGGVLGLDHLYKGSMQAGGLIGKSDPVVQGAKKYAEDNHVFSSDLFESSNQTRKNFGHYASKLSVPASKIESGTRQAFFLAMVDGLRDSYTPETGLYQTAHNLTDMAMNNYNASEAPLMYSVPGKALGGSAMNLMSFKQNELSRIAFFVEELKDKKAAMPLIANLVGQVAAGGLMGTVLYTEADWFVRKISEMMGKPTSLTEILLTSKNIPDMMKYGVGAKAGIDLTSRMGLGQVTPEVGINAVMPGLSSLVDQGAAYVEAAKDPSSYNVKKAVRETLPVGPLQGYADLKWFTTPEGKAINQRTGAAQVQRTPGDVYAKGFGVTGLNESIQKKRNYEENKLDQFYTEKRKDALDDLGKALTTGSAKDKQNAIDKYVKFRGDPNSLNRDLERLALEGRIDERTRAILGAQSATINNAYKLRSRAR